MNRARQAVIAEAVTWIGTPFHHAARVKGAGVDCLMLLAEVYERAGAAPHVVPPFYVQDWDVAGFCTTSIGRVRYKATAHFR